MTDERWPAWRPIGEDQPPHGEQVLLGWWGPNGFWDRNWECKVGAASWGWRRGGISNMSFHGRATHWLPLPPPPQEKADD